MSEAVFPDQAEYPLFSDEVVSHAAFENYAQSIQASIRENIERSSGEHDVHLNPRSGTLIMQVRTPWRYPSLRRACSAILQRLRKDMHALELPELPEELGNPTKTQIEVHARENSWKQGLAGFLALSTAECTASRNALLAERDKQMLEATERILEQTRLALSLQSDIILGTFALRRDHREALEEDKPCMIIISRTPAPVRFTVNGESVMLIARGSRRGCSIYRDTGTVKLTEPKGVINGASIGFPGMIFDFDQAIEVTVRKEDEDSPVDMRASQNTARQNGVQVIFPEDEESA